MLWKPAFFGVKPALILKGGFIAAAAMGDPNASIPTPQPVHYRPMFGAFGGALHRGSLTFMSQAAIAGGMPRRARPAQARRRREGLPQRQQAAAWCTTPTCPRWRSIAQTYAVRADGVLLTCEPATVLPMAQRYFLF